MRLSEQTTFRLGGECREWRVAETAREAAEALRDWAARGIPWRVMGGGSNLLVADAGIPEAVLQVKCGDAALRPVPGEEGLFAVAAGAVLDDVAARAAEEGLEGLTFANGIPGTIGGGTAGNAGAWGKALGDVVECVEWVAPDGSVRTAGRDELGFGYRQSRVGVLGGVLATVRLRLARGDRGRLGEERAAVLAERAGKHPDWRTERTAGSFFKNLPPAEPGGRRRAAGRLLEEAGAKAMRVGGARVFGKHANILVAEEGATAADVAELARRLQEAVAARFGVRLEPEVRYWGL